MYFIEISIYFEAMIFVRALVAANVGRKLSEFETTIHQCLAD